VYGDTSSSLAAAQAAEEIGSKLIHIEAGVRDFDMDVTEEGIRIQIDSMSDYLFCPSALCKTALSYEDIKGKSFNWQFESRCMKEVIGRSLPKNSKV
jgi:UDP-N-acetylglucosamine 2-epimerase